MSGNSFGKIFRITTWGESHGPAVGVVIDGCPAGVPLSVEDVTSALQARAPGRYPWTSPRREPDEAEILSGLFEGQTTGTPISIIVPNRDVDSRSYEPIKELYRPGHANYTYLKKYGVFDYRGGGRSSARETVGRVAAGAVAKRFLALSHISMQASLVEVGGVAVDEASGSVYQELILAAKREGDSLGGVIALEISALPAGLGEPVYDKIEALLGQAMLSLPATKGIEIGEGFRAARMRGSEHNDLFVEGGGTSTNHAGGTLGGITTGMPLLLRVAFKPTASIAHVQQTTTIHGKAALLEMPVGSRHDPCVAARAGPIVEAMAALVLADLLLRYRCSTSQY